MRFELTPELTQMREALRKFAKAELEPLENDIDRTGELPPHLLPLLGKQGYLSMRLPVEVGGAGMGLFPYGLMLEAFSRSHRVFGLLASSGGGLTPIAISRHGTPDQRNKYLTGLMDGTKRTAFAPQLPTIAESGLEGYEISAWQGILAPAGTPKEIVGRMSSEIGRILRQPDVVERLTAEGAEPVASTPEAFGEYLRAELARWSRIGREAGIRIE